MLIQELWLEGQSSGLVYLEQPTEGLSGTLNSSLQRSCQGMEADKLSLVLSSASLQLISIVQKGAYILFWCPDFSSATRGHLYIIWFWRPVRIMLMDGSHKTITNGERVLK